ncbi:hypothetical protein [Algiphilus sp.]|uniref:hypothetical protein n=1 Tax=Algiphilus sp. TaxID=1872431 RepID=UPI0025C63055|nr:hypothetical protein [Algiphilus sp.]MBY8964345.1 hypothetical protein [Algiphilus acroporae]MCI5064013.1 hypothetical protein [Algiphilus sp.]MCI5102484.1 hypothetical protein [Algiphilus sp.]MCR9092342.1 hypothetical protein [Pseudomonadota bacterium]
MFLKSAAPMHHRPFGGLSAVLGAGFLLMLCTPVQAVSEQDVDAAIAASQQLAERAQLSAAGSASARRAEVRCILTVIEDEAGAGAVDDYIKMLQAQAAGGDHNHPAIAKAMRQHGAVMSQAATTCRGKD